MIVSVFKHTAATRSDPETPETVAPVAALTAPLQLHVMAAPDIITSLGTATVELESIAARIAETQAQFVRSTADVPHLLGVLRSTRCAQLVPAATLVPAVDTQREVGRAAVDSRAAALRPILDALSAERQQLEKKQQEAAGGLQDAAGGSSCLV